MSKQKKGVRIEHISKIYVDPKTKKDFYAVRDISLDIEPVGREPLICTWWR